jgi:hypothetical protein
MPDDIPTEVLQGLKAELEKEAPTAFESLMHAIHYFTLAIINEELKNREKDKSNGNV